MRALIVLLAACSVRAPQVTAEHPASPAAPTGRLAPAPAALRAGVVDYKDVPELRNEAPSDGGHHHHH
jgi:hypothetical protein